MEIDAEGTGDVIISDRIDLRGGIIVERTTITGNHTIDSDDYLIELSTMATGDAKVSLPSAPTTDQPYVIINSNTSWGIDVLQGGSTLVSLNAKTGFTDVKKVEIMYNGTSWILIDYDN
jgi:hypothetical protein